VKSINTATLTSFRSN